MIFPLLSTSQVMIACHVLVDMGQKNCTNITEEHILDSWTLPGVRAVGRKESLREGPRPQVLFFF